MSADYMLAYRCRRCGTKHADTGTDNRGAATAALVEAITGGTRSTSIGVPLTLHDIHRCKDGGLGVSDLVGMDPKEPNG